MMLDKARELLSVQAGFGGFYNGNSAKLTSSEGHREHGQAAGGGGQTDPGSEAGRDVWLRTRYTFRGWVSR